MALAEKDPDATLEFGRDWSTWLAASGDTIVTSIWLVPAGLTVVDESNTATVALVWLSGGTAGQSYVITNRITTAQNRTDDRSIQIVVRQR
jgi:fructosamine-3-kinase